MYLGAVASASLISITFGQRATDTGLHTLAVALTAVSVLLLAATAAGRSLLEDRASPAAHRHLHLHGHHGMHLLELATPDRARRPDRS